MPRTYLIFLFGDVGDTLLTVPAIRAIRSRYPRARLVLLAKQTPAEIVLALGLADDALIVDKHLFDRPLALLQPRALYSLMLLLIRVRRERADTVVLFHHLLSRWGTLKFALLSFGAGAKVRVGLDNGRGWFLTKRAPDQGFGHMHEAEYWMRVAALLDARGDLRLAVPISERDREEGRRLLGDLDVAARPLMAIHPGTGWYGPGRRWPVERFATAITLVLQRRNMSCVIVGTGQEAREASELEALLGPHVVNLAGRTNLGELGAILGQCDVLIANDGGVAHVAAAVGIPVVAVFGPSNDRAWRPLTGTVVAADLACRPCFYRDHQTGLRMGCATRECLTLVTPRQVANAVLTELERSRAVTA